MSEAFLFDELTAPQRYKMLCAAVVPRPIAWITSMDSNGTVNAAPFSFFNVFSEEPPLVIIGINRKADGAMKDTLANIEATGAFTVNIAGFEQAADLVATAAAFPRTTGEPETLGLPLEDARTNGVPRLADAPIALECCLFESRALGPERHLVIGTVKALIARDGLFDRETLRIDPAGFTPLARLHGSSYASLGPTFDLVIPDWRDAGPDRRDAGQNAKIPGGKP